MQLTLSRYNPYGNTSGLWLVKELPGVMIIRSDPQTWVIIVHRPDRPFTEYDRVWGMEWKLTPDILIALNQTKGNYPSRAAALFALQNAISKPQENNLGEII